MRDTRREENKRSEVFEFLSEFFFDNSFHFLVGWTLRGATGCVCLHKERRAVAETPSKEHEKTDKLKRYSIISPFCAFFRCYSFGLFFFYIGMKWLN